jgi:methyl-accepting chemotaxis protein
MGRAMHDIAEGEGDLTKRLTIHAHDEFGAWRCRSTASSSASTTSIREVSSATGQVNEVAGGGQRLELLDPQCRPAASRTSSVAAAINQLGAAAQEIAQNAALASQHSSDARGLAEDGQQVVANHRGDEPAVGAHQRSCGNIETLNSNTVNIGQILE